MITRKDFNKIAEIINRNLDKNFISKNIIEELSIYFKTQNPNFNGNKFKEACLKWD